MKMRAVFLDRDGTINGDLPYSPDPEKMNILPGVIQALVSLKEHGWLLVVVSNQSGVGRGYFGLDELYRFQESIEAELSMSGVRLDGFYFCPHTPADSCGCRKPEPGLLLQASREMGIDLAQSWMVGDKVSDVLAGWRAGCRSILIDKELTAETVSLLEMRQTETICPDLLTAVQFILKGKL